MRLIAGAPLGLRSEKTAEYAKILPNAQKVFGSYYQNGIIFSDLLKTL